MGAVELTNLWLGAEGWIGPVIAAPFVGSFAGVLAMRLPGGRDVAWSRSACDACGSPLGPLDLVPIISFVAMRGRCRHCAAPIGRAHLLVELACTGIALWAALTGERGALLWAGCVLGWTLLTLAWIDAVSFRLPDLLTLPLLLAGLIEAALLEPDALAGRSLGAALGYSGFVLLAWGYRRLRGQDGLGAGDAKLLAAGGAWVGGLLLPEVLLGSALAGLAWALRHLRVDTQARLAFGPFLAAGIWLAWLYG